MSLSLSLSLSRLDVVVGEQRGDLCAVQAEDVPPAHRLPHAEPGRV